MFLPFDDEVEVEGLVHEQQCIDDEVEVEKLLKSND